MKVLTLHIILPHFSIKKKIDKSKLLNINFPRDDFFFFNKVVNQMNNMIWVR